MPQYWNQCRIFLTIRDFLSFSAPQNSLQTDKTLIITVKKTPIKGKKKKKKMFYFINVLFFQPCIIPPPWYLVSSPTSLLLVNDPWLHLISDVILPERVSPIYPIYLIVSAVLNCHVSRPSDLQRFEKRKWGKCFKLTISFPLCLLFINQF